MQEENEHIDENFLRSLDTSGGFEVPENYFPELETKLLRKTTEHAFKVTPAYFETLGSRIEQRISAEKNKKHGRIIAFTPSRWIKAAGSVAAAVLISCCIYFFSNRQAAPYGTALQRLSEDDILEYVDASDLQEETWVQTAVKPGNKHAYQEDENSTDESIILDEL